MTLEELSSKLTDLHHQMRSCRKCLDAGHQIIPKAIFSGPASANVMIIGQAPGTTEVEAGRPFNASSGKRLFEWLGRAGFNEAVFRSNEYMTSVTKCFPGKAKNGSGDRVPTREERALCSSFLHAELKLVQPRLVIPVGRLAINHFYPAKDPLFKIIGTAKKVERFDVIPLPHPSGASRWHQIQTNRGLIDQAIKLIARYRKQIYRDALGARL